jgi:hypothetical protein
VINTSPSFENQSGLYLKPVGLKNQTCSASQSSLEVIEDLDDYLGGPHVQRKKPIPFQQEMEMFSN